METTGARLRYLAESRARPAPASPEASEDPPTPPAAPVEPPREPVAEPLARQVAKGRLLGRRVFRAIARGEDAEDVLRRLESLKKAGAARDAALRAALTFKDGNNWTVAHAAAAVGNADALRRLLRLGASPKWRTAQGADQCGNQSLGRSGSETAS